MTQTHKSKKYLLIERIKTNYSLFQLTLYGISRDKLIKMARQISIVTEAYELATKYYEWDEAEEIDFYLMFRDPLTIIADAWEKHRNKTMEDFDGVMFHLAFDDSIISEYPLIEGIDENLCKKYIAFR